MSHGFKVSLQQLIFELVAVLTLRVVLPVSILVFFLSLVAEGLVDVSSPAGLPGLLSAHL